MKNKYFYPIYKLKIKSWIKYWLIKQTEFKGVLSDILEGISFYLTDSLNMKFKMFKIYGRTIQDGNPTPENPVPIKNTGDNGSVNEKVQNKNIFDKNNVSSNTYLGSNNVSLARTEAIASDYIPVNDINFVLTAKNTYTSTNYYVVNQYNGNKEFISGNEYTLTANFDLFKSLTLNSSCKYVKLSFRYYDTYISEAQLEQGTTASDYVPHEEQNISFPLAEGQKFYEGSHPDDDEKVHHKMGEIILDGTVGGYNADYNWFYLSFTNLQIQKPKTLNILSNYFKYYNRNEFAKDTSLNGISFNTADISTASTFVIRNTNCTNATEYKNWLAEVLPKVIYELAEETTEDFTSAQQTAWEQIKALRTYKNVTHITSSDETPALLKIQYWKEG